MEMSLMVKFLSQKHVKINVKLPLRNKIMWQEKLKIGI